MKKFFQITVLIMALTTSVFAVGEAGAVWLLIKPGARAAGMGEVGGAVADDVYATYYNPSGLGFQSGRSFTVHHVNWLSNLGVQGDMYFDFLGYKQYFEDYGTIGGNITIMNLGEQWRTDAYGNKIEKFRSYYLATTGSYGTRLSRNTSFGLNFKLIYQHLTSGGAGREKGSGNSTNLALGVGYMKKEFLLDNLTLGLSIQNIGNKITFIDVEQADPMPTNLKLGFNYEIKQEYNTINIAYDINKLLVTRYPPRDLNGDGKIGGYNESGDRIGPSGEYNNKGQMEEAHTDPWYKAIFTSWVDDWFLYKNPDLDGDGKVGGWNKEGEKDSDGKYNSPETGNGAEKEVKTGSLGNELETLVHNFGIEYWYANKFAVRVGFLYDKAGDITMNGLPVPTFGTGLRYAGMRFDFGYTAGENDHPRANTMHFSIKMNL